MKKLRIITSRIFLAQLIATSLIFSAGRLSAQETISLNFRSTLLEGAGVTTATHKLTQLASFKGTPSNGDFAVFAVNLQKRQSTYTNYLKGYFTREEMDHLFQTYNYDMEGLYTKTDINNSITVLLKQLDTAHYQIIPDLNFNNDFSDDRIFESQSDIVKAAQTLHIDYDYVLNGEPVRRELSFKLVPEVKSFRDKTGDDNKLDLFIVTEEVKTARATIDGLDYEFRLTHGDFEDLNAKYRGYGMGVRCLSIGSGPERTNRNFLSHTTLGQVKIKVGKVSYFGDRATLIAERPK